LALVDQVDELYSAKGKRVVHVDLQQERPDDESLKKLLLGPTGNLRAPTIRVGKTLIVGFNQELYADVLSALP